MSDAEKPQFSKVVLDLSERTQQAIGHTRLGRRAIRAVTGSRSPAYRQLDWFSRDITSKVTNTVTVPADPWGAMFVKNLDIAVVMATTDEELERLHKEVGRGPYKEAVAYISEDVTHVGIDPNSSSLFGRLNEDERAIAMRRGRGPLEAAMGMWLPERRTFVGTEVMRIENRTVHTSVFSPSSQIYPRIPLV